MVYSIFLSRKSIPILVILDTRIKTENLPLQVQNFNADQCISTIPFQPCEYDSLSP
jgi:hypothetical protein